MPGIDVRMLPLSAVEGYVYSRVDGRCSLSEIAAVTGLEFDLVSSICDKLEGLGALRYLSEAEQASRAAFDGNTKPRMGALPGQPVGARAQPSQGPFGNANTGTFDGPTGTMNSPRGAARVRSPGTHLSSGAASERVERLRPASASLPPQDRTNPRVYVGDRVREHGEGMRDERPRSGRAQSDSPFAPERTQEHVQSNRAHEAETRSTSAAPAINEPLRYDPRELEEDVDLPYERRKQLLDLYYRLDEVDYYEALGVLYTADKKEIRAAYFALSKVFHPDSMFRKNLGSFKPKMVAVFQYLTEAYETLSKKKSRDEYDAYLRATKATKLAEQALRQAAIQREQPPPPPPEPSPSERAMAGFPRPDAPPPKLEPPRPVSEEARRLAQEVITRRLRSVTQRLPTRVVEAASSPSSPSPTVEPPAFEGAQKGDPQDLLRRLARTLKDVSQVTGSHDHLGRAIKASREAFERGDLNEAAAQMNRALSLSNNREDLRLEYERISKALAEKMAQNYAEQAKFEAKTGKWASAALSWAKVCEGKPDDFMAHRSAAYALYKAGGDLRGAQKYAQQAVFLAPNDIDSRILLAQIYMTIGLKLNARRELEAAAKLDPGNEMVKNLLGDLKT